MTAREEALALLRERFPEPWDICVAYFDKESGPIFFGIPECQWQARAELLQPIDGQSRDNVTLYAWRESPLEAARACIAAANEAGIGERALADRLAEALEDYYNGLPSHGAQSAIAAWRAARGRA